MYNVHDSREPRVVAVAHERDSHHHLAEVEAQVPTSQKHRETPSTSKDEQQCRL